MFFLNILIYNILQLKKSTIMTQENVKPTKTAQKYLTIIASGTIQESEIVSMRSFMGKDKGNAQLIFSALDGKELTLYGEQVQKGIDFLTNHMENPTWS
jgi:hypothetical protein